MIFYSTGCARVVLLWNLLLKLRIFDSVSLAMVFNVRTQSSCIRAGSWFKSKHHAIRNLIIHLKKNIWIIRRFFRILFLSYQNSFFEELGILASIKGVALHALLCLASGSSVVLHKNFNWFKLFLFINSIIFIIIYQNRI